MDPGVSPSWTFTPSKHVISKLPFLYSFTIWVFLFGVVAPCVIVWLQCFLVTSQSVFALGNYTHFALPILKRFARSSMCDCDPTATPSAFAEEP